MRAFETIKRQKLNEQEEIEKQKKVVDDLCKSTFDVGFGYGLGPVLFSIMASVFTLFMIGMYRNKFSIEIMVVVGFFWLLFLIGTVVGSIEDCIKKFTYSSLRTLPFFYVVFFLFSVSLIFLTLSGKPLLFTVFPYLKTIILDSFKCSSKEILYIDFILFFPNVILLPGFTIKFILVNKRIIKCKNKIAICETTISELNEELEETMKESQRIYKEETAKEQPDMLCIEELAKLGYQPAQRWLNKTNCQHGKQIFEEEIKKETPDLNNIIKAADLGCPEACMYYAEPLLLGFKSDYSSDPFVDDNDRLTTSSPKLRLCLKLQPYFRTAAKAKIPNAKFYYLYTTERAGCTQYMDYCFSDMDLTTLKKEFEALMKATNLDNKYKGICQQCLKRIEKAKGERYVKKNRAELAKWSGFYSDLPSYQRMVNSTNKSTSKTVEAVEYYPVIDVSGM